MVERQMFKDQEKKKRSSTEKPEARMQVYTSMEICFLVGRASCNQVLPDGIPMELCSTAQGDHSHTLLWGGMSVPPAC